MNVRHEEGPLARRNDRGPALYYYATLPEGPPKITVGLLHGYAEHGKRYAHVADAWAARGIATLAIDLRGHGRAEGQRGHCNDFREYVDDVAELASLVRERQGPGPAALFGHSFGGLVALSAMLSYGDAPSPWASLALSAPYLGLALPVPPLKILGGKFASRIVPGLSVPTGLRGADVTRDVERARAYDADPLVFKNATARWFTETAAAQERVLAKAASITTPLYLVMGTADRLAKLSTARAFFEAVGSRDKTWDERPGLFHEVLNEPEWRPIADRLGEWITAR
jgi:alpha-beta hydrolase superfamily lysophospholipase